MLYFFKLYFIMLSKSAFSRYMIVHYNFKDTNHRSNILCFMIVLLVSKERVHYQKWTLLHIIGSRFLYMLCTHLWLLLQNVRGGSQLTSVWPKRCQLKTFPQDTSISVVMHLVDRRIPFWQLEFMFKSYFNSHKV